MALSKLLGQDFVNRGSFLEPERGLLVRDTRFVAGPNLGATLELKF